VGLALGAGLTGACGGDDSASPPADSQLPGLTASAADCKDWNRASAEERLATVEAIREFQGGPTTGAEGSTLPDEQAYDVFEGWCENDFARSFKLYKLYARAAAFQSPAPGEAP
jgi:hypothetical protein